MVKIRPLDRKVKKLHHLTKEKNEFGVHDRFHFHAHHEDIPLRCFQCSNLMASDFTSEGECPNCHWLFTKSEARDMYVEALICKMHGGWDKEKLDVFSPYDYPVRINQKTGKVERIDDVERTMAAWATKAAREHDTLRDLTHNDKKWRAIDARLREQYETEKQLIKAIRKMSPTSRLMDDDGTGGMGPVI